MARGRKSGRKSAGGLSDERLNALARERQLVRVWLRNGERFGGVLIACAPECLLVRVDDDWARDGWALVPRRAIARVRERPKGFQEFAERIGLRRSVPRPDVDPAAGVRSVLEQLRHRGGLVEVHTRTRSTFSAGRLMRVGNSTLSLHRVDQDGVREPRSKRIQLAGVQQVAWESGYARAYERILTRTGGKQTVRRDRERFDVRGPRAVPATLRELVGRERSVQCTLGGRSDRSYEGVVVEVAADHVLLASWDRVAFDGWIALRLEAITRVRRTPDEANEDLRRQLLGVRVPRLPLRPRSIGDVLAWLQRRRQLCILRCPYLFPDAVFSQFVRVESATRVRIWPSQLDFDGRLWGPGDPVYSSRVSAVEFGGRYLRTYQQHLIVPNRA